jgi:HNH endonuclease
MKEITLTRGKIAFVDDWNYEWLNQFKWCVRRNRKNGQWYALRQVSGGRKKQLMHRVLLGDPVGMQIDHRDGNGLNNTESNLRIATPTQNQCNRGKTKANTSGFKGVTKFKGKWKAQIQVNKKLLYLGLFDTAVEAAAVWNWAAKKFHGEFAFQNEF